MSADLNIFDVLFSKNIVTQTSDTFVFLLLSYFKRFISYQQFHIHNEN